MSVLATRVNYEGDKKDNWDDLCNNYPWCSQSFQLENDY